MFFFQAEDGIRDLVRSRGLGDVYKRQGHENALGLARHERDAAQDPHGSERDDEGMDAEEHLSLIHI